MASYAKGLVTPRDHGFFSSKNHGIEEILIFFLLLIFIILSDIEESTIRFSYFYLFKVQRWLNRFVYIKTDRSCCPLNCSTVQAKSPISRSPNCLSSCSTSSSRLAATTSMSGSKQLWAGQAFQLPGLALHLYHQVVGHHPGQLIHEAQ